MDCLGLFHVDAELLAELASTVEQGEGRIAVYYDDADHALKLTTKGLTSSGMYDEVYLT